MRSQRIVVKLGSTCFFNDAGVIARAASSLSSKTSRRQGWLDAKSSSYRPSGGPGAECAEDEIRHGVTRATQALAAVDKPVNEFVTSKASA